MSMQASVSGHMLLDDAITKAAGVVTAYGPSDRFQLITNDFEGRHQQFYSKDEFLKLLNEIQVSAPVKMLTDVFRRQQELAPQGMDAHPAKQPLLKQRLNTKKKHPHPFMLHSG